MPEQEQAESPVAETWSDKVGVAVSDLVEELTRLVAAAHRLDCTAVGQDLRPTLRATSRLIREVFPPGSQQYHLALAIEREIAQSGRTTSAAERLRNAEADHAK